MQSNTVYTNTLPRLKQRWVALLIALLVVAIATVIAVNLSNQNYLMVKRAYRQINYAQAQSYLKELELFASKVLIHDLDFAASSGIAEPFDSCSDIWSRQIDKSPQEGISYGGQLTDLGGRINLNSMNSNASTVLSTDQSFFPYTVEQARFANLLQAFEDLGVYVEPYLAQRVTAALLDWVDPDDQITAGIGAEAGYYESLGIDARPPNAPMTHVSELIVVLQVLENPQLAADLYELLEPNVRVWPLSGEPDLNINTASDDVIRSLNVSRGNSLNQPLDIESYEREVLANLATPYLSQTDAQTQLSTLIQNASQISSGTGNNNTPLLNNITVNSHFFELNAYATLGDFTTRMYTVLERYQPQTTIAQTQQAGAEAQQPSSDVRVRARSRHGLNISCPR